jgi:GTP diphosphokinase / guanosine-3',5'-bis(diphosphate) 3'-diphosphatase
MALKALSEQSQISNRYRRLLRASKESLSAEELINIRSAIKFAASLYSGKKTAAGEPYVTHLIDVARICAEEIGLSGVALTAALLHETLADKVVTPIELEKRFGATLVHIVDGLTRISKIDPKDPKSQSENFRELIVTLAKDARVILIMLADRLETMRSLGYEEEGKQLKTSWEAFYLYAPLAHRLGLYKVKSEMEDLAMKFTNTQDYKGIVRKLKNTSARRNKFIKEFISPIESELCRRKFDFEIKGRPKSIYSIWKKIQKQEVPFEEVYDVFAIRIILNSPPEREKSDCWQVYSIITDWWTPNPERLRDWVSVPKSNGYESLHITVVGPEGKFVEVQIRTRRMDEVAEKGLAAHWKYKGVRQDQGLDMWLSRIRETLDAPSALPEDIVDNFQTSLYSKEIYAFTPNGDLKKFPMGATILDFAFEIHSNLGSQCVGGKVNGKNVPIKQILQNGDVVEIITAKNQRPKTDWLQIVVTGKARARIKQSLRDEKNKQLSVGKETLYRRLKNWKVDDVEGAIITLTKHLKLKNSAKLFEKIASDQVNLMQLKEVLARHDKPAEVPPLVVSNVEPATKPSDEESEKFTSDYLIIDEKLVNIDYKLARCCKPILGDDIFGFVTIGEGIKIHRTSCPNAPSLHARYGYRVVKARWKQATTAVGSFQTTIKVTGYDELGMLNKISEVISKDLKVNIRSFSIGSANGMFEGTIQLYVFDTKHLEMLLYRLSKIKGIVKAIRVRG